MFQQLGALAMYPLASGEYAEADKDEMAALNGNMGPADQLSTAYQNLKMSPEGREAQMRALQNYWRQAQGGPNIEDKAATEAIMEPLANQERAQQGAIMGNFAQRGRSGGGGEMAARMQSASNAANSARASGTNLAAAAYRRAMDANTAAAGLGGAVRGQDYTQASDLARAQDNVGAANAAARERANQRNYQMGLEKASIYRRRGDRFVGIGSSVGQVGDDILDQGTKIAGTLAGMPRMGGGGSSGGNNSNWSNGTGGVPYQTGRPTPSPYAYGAPEDEQWKTPLAASNWGG